MPLLAPVMSTTLGAGAPLRGATTDQMRSSTLMTQVRSAATCDAAHPHTTVQE